MGPLHCYRRPGIRAWPLLFLALCLFFPCGCREGVSRDPNALYAHLGAEPDTLNPVISSDAYSATINSHIYETLLDMDLDTLDRKADLAERWEISPDRRRYRFYLKKGVLWNDGVEFTADDVVYSFNVIKDPKTANAHRKVNYLDIVSVKKVDRYTVDFIYAKEYYLGLEICGGMTIVPRHIFDNNTDINTHANNRFPVGTGPYTFTEWVTGSRIVLGRNELYREKKPEIKRIVYKIVPEASVALQMLKKGDLDYMGVRPIQWIRQTVSGKFTQGYYKFQYFTPNYSYIGWNARNELFADYRVRQALSHLINLDAILEKLLFGLGKRVAGTFYLYGKNYNKNLEPMKYDPQKAAELLRQAGWADEDNDGVLEKNGKKFSFTFTISSGSKFAERLGTIMKEDFRKAGIAMEINRFEWAVFSQKLIKRDFDAVTLSWSLGYNEDPYDLWHSSQVQAGFNFVGFRDSEADLIMERGRREFNTPARTRLFRRLEEILYREQPYTFMFCSPALVVVSRKFDNVVVHKAGLDIEEWKFRENQ
ncbi:MAG TPA: peptide-binding protein [Spirochaetota bacterium]|nr:peptide-binding protein [Spirochaetota bacterium]HPI88836.1 peptide-binding protein [Spirochaetota bacterium]HPR47676.1 peptide-binding protein [Spirochaetota bacterium]